MYLHLFLIIAFKHTQSCGLVVGGDILIRDFNRSLHFHSTLIFPTFWTQVK